MGTSRCSTWTTSTSGMVGAFALEPPEQPAVPSATNRETITAQVVTFDIVLSPFVADSGPKAPPVRHRSVSVLSATLAISSALPMPGEAPVRQLLAAAQATDSGTFSVLRLLDAEIPASTEYCAKRSAGRNHGSDRDSGWR